VTEITQADRDAAAELLAQRGFTTEWVEQAFARHREEARNTRNAPADVVEAANNLTVKLTEWLIKNDALPEDGSMVKVTDRFGTFCDDLLTEALADRVGMRELLREARDALEPFAKAAMGVDAFDPDFPSDGAALRASFDWYDKAQSEPLKRHSVRRSDLDTARHAIAQIDAALEGQHND